MNSSIATIVLIALTTAGVYSHAADRLLRQAPGSAPVWSPTILKHRLSNGLTAWVVEQHELPVVQMSLMVRTGTAVDPPGRFGIASLTSALLTEGAGARSTVAIADELDVLFANLSASSTPDTSFVRLYVPVAGLAAALPVMADVTQNPAFPPPRLEYARQQRLGTLRRMRDDPGTIAGLLLARGVYGPSHRNAAPQIGTASSLGTTTVEHLRTFHRSAYRPDNSTLVVVGDVKADDVLSLIETHFGKWLPAGSPETVRPQAPQVQRPARQLLLADLPDAPQARILIGGLSAMDSVADLFPVQILNAVLRARFNSARNLTLRDYTAGVRLGFDRRRFAGLLAVATAVQGHKTAEALAELLAELTGIPKGISDDELARAKDDVALEFSRTFESTGRISSRLQAIETLVTFDLPDDDYSTYQQTIQAISEDNVRDVAVKYLQPEHLVIAIAGDRKTIEPQIRAAGIGSPTSIPVDDLLAPAP